MMTNVQLGRVEGQLPRDLLQALAGAVHDGALAGTFRRTGGIILAGADLQQVPLQIPIC